MINGHVIQHEPPQAQKKEIAQIDSYVQKGLICRNHIFFLPNQHLCILISFWIWNSPFSPTILLMIEFQIPPPIKKKAKFKNYITLKFE